MKKILLTTVTAIGLVSYAKAVNITVTSTFGQAIVDNSGAAFADGTGVITIGTFADESVIASATSTSALLNEFTAVQSTGGGIESLTFGFGGFGGVYEGIIDTGALTAGGTGINDGLAGQTVYTFIGNASTLAASDIDQITIFRHDFTFAATDPTNPIEPTASAVLGDGQGGAGAGAFLRIGDTNGVSTVNIGGADLVVVGSLAAVPEPSSIALLSLGVVGFVIRRRR